MKKIFLYIAILLLANLNTSATHIFGGEFTYEVISGNNYRFNLTLYADCAGNPTLIANLYSATPQIQRFNNNSPIDFFNLTLIPGSGIEVTPVCPSQLNNTTCVSTNGTVPGVRQFRYTGTKNLGSASANWKFMFWGELLISNNQTGRSSNISNINSTTCGPSGTTSKMAFEANLNNLVAPNSSVNYTTIPTPFHCIGKAQSYNQGAVDPDGDLLSFALDTGIDGNNTNIPISCYVDYSFPYTALAPLNAVAGTFNFSTTTGQLNYTPNATQYSLVVVTVTERRNGVVVGSTMREMSFVVLPNCNNTPPGGFLNTVTAGYIDSQTNIYVCKDANSLVFTVPATDSDGNNVNVTYTGLPQGCTLNVANNGTSSPSITGTYSPAGGFVVGNYNFFITYEDDGCPLTSKQTIAYTIHVLPSPSATTTIVQPTCLNGNMGSILVTASGGTPTYQYILGTSAPVPGSLFSSVVAGTYPVSVVDSKGCKSTVTVTLIAPPLPTINSVVKTTASCVPGCDATFTINATTPSNTAMTYSTNAGVSYQNSNIFTNVCIGSYTIVAKDANGCSITSVISIINPALPVITNITSNPATCVPGCDGSFTAITATSATSSSFTYALNVGAFQATNSFNSLCLGTYTITVKDVAGCTKSSIATIGAPPGPTISSLNTSTASCNPGCDGTITNIIASSAIGGIQFKLNTGGYQVTNSFTSLCAGSYTLTAKDANGCISTSVAIILTQPNPVISGITTTKASCVPGCDGTMAVSASASSGLTLQYKTNLTGFQSSNNFSNLCAGAYTITVEDTKGCTATSAVSISQESNPVITTNESKNITCFGYGNGKITILATGTGTITYLLNPTNTTNATGLFSNLQANTYSVLVKDAKGCTTSQSFTIIEPFILAFVSVTKEDKTCEFKNNGLIDIKIIGGTTPINYVITGQALQTNNGLFTGLNSGNYSITVTDANGCSIASNITILPPFNPIQISTTFKSIPCTGVSTDGWAEVAAVNGTQPYTYNWNTSPVQTTSRIENLYAGVFIVTVTDAKGCDLSDTVELRDPAFCCTDIYIPNTFTPNDDGKNDKLEILTSTILINPNLLIFDRWGNKVYETTDIKKYWNGEYPSNIQGDLAIYYYLLKYKCAVNNKDYVKKGDVLLLK